MEVLSLNSKFYGVPKACLIEKRLKFCIFFNKDFIEFMALNVGETVIKRFYVQKFILN